MTSKEALEKISWRYVNDTSFQEWCEIVKQYLERLEKLEIESFEDMLITEQNIKLKKVIEILKDIFEIVAIKDYDSECVIETSSYFLHLTKEQYDLLMEYLK